jgi:hypothetical protein
MRSNLKETLASAKHDGGLLGLTIAAAILSQISTGTQDNTQVLEGIFMNPK